LSVLVTYVLDWRGDSAYIGPSNNRLTCSEINILNDLKFLTAVEYNRHLNKIRAPIEQCIGGSKRGSLIGDRAKTRMSLKTTLAKVVLFDELAVYLHAAIMRMRGQVWQSNSAVLSMEYQSNIANQIYQLKKGG
jgi:hypothetical protein